MIKLYDYGDEPKSQLEKISRHEERQSAPSGWLLASTAICFALAVFLIMLAAFMFFTR